MNDPNRIVERIDKLLNTARSAIEEAKTIFDGAVSNHEDAKVVETACGLFERFCDTLSDEFESSDTDYLSALLTVALPTVSEPPPAVLLAMAHAMSEWFNDRAPINEAMYLEPARSVWKAMVKALEPKPEGGVH